MTCEKCGARRDCLINNRCPACGPLLKCPFPGCVRGTLVPNGTPAWQNRYTCDVCRRHASR